MFLWRISAIFFAILMTLVLVDCLTSLNKRNFDAFVADEKTSIVFFHRNVRDRGKCFP